MKDPDFDKLEDYQKQRIVVRLNEFTDFLSEKYTAYMSYAMPEELLVLAKLKYPHTKEYTSMSIKDAMRKANDIIENRPKMQEYVYLEDSQGYHFTSVLFKTDAPYSIHAFEEVSHRPPAAGRFSTGFGEFKKLIEGDGYTVKEIKRFEKNTIPEGYPLIKGATGNYQENQMTKEQYKEYKKLELLKYQLDNVLPYELLKHDSKFDHAAAAAAARFREFINNEIRIAEDLQEEL